MGGNPLQRLPALWPALFAVNSGRRRVLGALRAVGLTRLRLRTGSDPRQELVVWTPPDPRGAVLLLHGGGWMEGSWRDFASLGPSLARRGLMAAAVGYRLGPTHRWPAQLDDALAAADVLAGEGAPPGRVGLWGHSAGAQIALVAALREPERFRCVVGIGAPADLVSLRRETLGPELGQVFDEADLVSASPLRVPCPRPPPILLVHGGEDLVCPVGQARSLRDRWPAAVELVEVAGGDHGLRWPPRAALAARGLAVRWLVDRLSR